MKKIYKFYFIVLTYFILTNSLSYSQNQIPADNPYIQYYGRWDFSDPKAPTHSWPGVYIYAEFEGTSIGVMLNDNNNYYNVFIDDTLFSILHCTKSGISLYPLADSLPDGRHKILFTLRNETNWAKFPFNGFVLDNGKNLLQPPDKPVKRIEFIGDSYTCAAGDLWTDNNSAPNADLYTDIFEGFGPIVCTHYRADYMMSAHSGYGVVHDYLGNFAGNLPDIFNRTLVYTPLPVWDFSKWVPNLVVIVLGLNDYSGWGGYSGQATDDEAMLFRSRYHDFISTIMDVYPGANILAVAPNDIDWLKQNISQVASEENALGHTNVFYTYFPYVNGGYVNGGHPNVATHHIIANSLISAIDSINAWQPFQDKTIPKFTLLPTSPFTVTSSSYTLTVKTDKYATVKYSTSDLPYDQMENQFTTTTGTRTHSVTLSVKQNQQYTYYLRAMDQYGNKMNSSAVIKFSVDTTKTIVAWNAPGYDITNWKLGDAPLGNDSNGDYITQIDTVITAYFRQNIPLQNVSNISGITVTVYGHDGVIAYVNGHEISMINMDTKSDISYNTYSMQAMTLKNNIFLTPANGLNYLKDGDNVFAFEIHSSYSSIPAVLFSAKIVDGSTGNTIYDQGGNWYYYDKRNYPADQITNKITGVFADANRHPDKISLYPNYPNPFNPSTNISFDLNKSTHVQLKIFNMLGQLVETLIDNDLKSGKFTYKFDSKNLASGIYFYQLKTDTFSDIKKMVLMK